MIQKIKFISFGKIKQWEFAPGMMNLLYGPNEAGKSTFYDALLLALTGTDRKKKEGRQIYTRYGIDAASLANSLEIHRQQGALPSSPKPLIPVEDFVKVYSISGSDVALSLEPGDDWFKRLKHKLFSGGTDPSLVKADLKKNYAEMKGNNPRNKERKQLSEQINGLEQQLQALYSERKTLQIKEEQIQRDGAKKRELEEQLSAVTEQIQELRSRLDREDRIHRLQQLKEIYRLIDRERSLAKNLDQLATFEQDEKSDLDRLDREVEQNKSNLINLQSKIQNESENLEELDASIQKEEEKIRALAQKLELLRPVKEEIEKTVQSPPRKKITGWSSAGIVLAVGSFLLSVVSLIAALTVLAKGEGMMWPVVLFAVGALFMGGGFFSLMQARKEETSTDHDELNRIIRIEQDRWTNATGQAPEAQSLTGMLEQYNALEASHRQALTNVESVYQRKRGKEAQFKELQKQQSESQALLDESVATLHSWFQKRGIEDRDGYIAMQHKYRSVKQQLQEAGYRIDQLRGEMPASRDELQSECSRLIHELEQDGLDTEGITESQRNHLRSEWSRKNEHKQKLTAELNEISNRYSGSSGELRVELQNNGQSIVSISEQLHQANASMRGIELDRQAAEHAIQLLDSLEEKSRDIFESLAEELAHYYAGFFPEVRQVKVEKLADDGIHIQDREGTLRPLSLLSSGTRDAFVFAARLAFLTHVGDPAMAPLVCDDPFLTLDESRIRSGMEILRDFQAEKGFQIFFLTKDRLTRRIAEEVFSDMKTIDLEVDNTTEFSKMDS